MAAALWSGQAVFAADVTYTGISGGEWATGGNWSSSSYPGNSDIAVLDTTANLSIEAPNNIQGIRIGTNGTGRLQIGSYGTLTANSNPSVPAAESIHASSINPPARALQLTNPCNIRSRPHCSPQPTS